MDDVASLGVEVGQRAGADLPPQKTQAHGNEVDSFLETPGRIEAG